MTIKKKIFPKIKKKLHGFLTDESGKITKKDALGLGAGAILLAGIENVSAGHTNSGGHSNSYPNRGYRDWRGSPSCTPSVSHVSGVVNGHYSTNVTASLGGHREGAKTLYSHGSHGSHGSHSSSGSGSGDSGSGSGSGSGDY